MKYMSLLFLCIYGNLFAQTNEPITPAWNSDFHRQFDFWVGEWEVNLRIKQADGIWEDKVQSTARIYRILDGKAVLELWNENKVDEGIKGYSLRYFREDLNKWELWLNWPGKNRSGSSSLKGSFRHGRGEFFSEFPKNDSVTITQRYTFCDITPISLRWDNASSEDGGITWIEGNWIMEFIRTKDLAPDPSEGTAVLTHDSGNRCDLNEFSFFDDWVGRWTGKMRAKVDGKWKNTNSELEVYPVLDGCAIMVFMNYKLDGEPIKSFSLNTYNTYASTYEEGFLDNRSKSNFNIRYGVLKNDMLTLIDQEESAKSVWKKTKSKLTWDFYKKAKDQWEHHKSVVFVSN